MRKSCRQCSQVFEITSEDLAFYEKVSPVFHGKKELIPPPTLCPECRMQRRLAWRNERQLYLRKCDQSNRQIISLYSSDKPYRVYEPTAWWADNEDYRQQGLPWDEESLLSSVASLFMSIPHLSKMNVHCENCEYANQSYGSKNCYMSVATDFSEDCYFTDYSARCRNCSDCFSLSGSELCYECIDCINCYHCCYVQRSVECKDCFFCFDCKQCKYCFGCTSLRNQSYCIYNSPVSEHEWHEKVGSLVFSSNLIGHSLNKSLQSRLLKPHLFSSQTNCEDCSGDTLENCKRACHSFDMQNITDAKYCQFMPSTSNDVYDCIGGGGELQYECSSVGVGYHNAFCHQCWNSVSGLYYCFLCMNCKNSFACIGLRNAEYCILNKQYTKEEYETLVPKIIAKMRADGEWGEFFPASMSPFGYNETVAQEYFPLTKEEVLKRGWKWHDEEEKRDQYMGPPYVIPDDITNVSDDITKHILTCEVTGKPYKIIPQELKFYREMGIPIPRRCADQRHKDRMALRNPRKLWKRQCAKCAAAIETTYAPERPEIVYCETCYLSTVY